MIGAVYTEQDLMDTPSKNGLDGTAPHIAAQLRSLALPIDDVHADPANARVHDRRNLDAIKASMAKFGQRSPLVVQRQGMVVRAGNGRLIAARELGWDQIAAVVVDEDDVSATSYAIADNRTGELATWDDEALAGLLRSMESEMLVASGFTDEELGELCGIPKDLGDVTEDEAPEPPAEPVTKVGDLWALGRHRVLCGDSTKADDVARCLGGAEPFLMVTDPPYGVDYAALVKSRGNQKKGGWADIENDALDVDDLEALLTAALACPSAKVAFVWHPPGAKRWAFWRALETNGWRISQEIVWAKNALVFGRADYQWRHEPCMYAKREGAGRQEDRTQTTLWEIDKQANANHPTEKPVECMARPIRNHGGKSDTVYDPFLGSGTTLIAAEQLGRTCYGIEISPAYCDVIVQRWENLTGQKARLITDDVAELFS